MLKIKIILFLLLVSSVNSFAQKLTVAEKAVFDEIVYYRRVIGEYEAIYKWKNPIIYKIHGDTSSNLVKEVDSFFNLIKKITALDIKKANRNDKENFWIIIASEPGHFPKRLDGKNDSEIPYSHHINRSINYECYSAPMLINTKKIGSYTNNKNAIKKLIVKCLGFYKDSELAPNSIFNMKASSHKITDFDLHIISALYNKKIKGGMTKDEVDKILNQE